MGRILRKKPAGAKKRKKAEAELPPSPGAPPASPAGTEERRPAETRPVRPAPALRKPPAASASSTPGVASERFWHRAIQFLREVKVELKKVTWPSRKQTLGSTLVVIVLVLLISTFLGLVDLALSTIVRAVFQ